MRGNTTDISENGVFLATSLPADPGARLRLKIVLGNERIEAEGRVVRFTPHLGMGIEFHQISDNHRRVVRNLVESAGSGPAPS